MRTLRTHWDVDANTLGTTKNPKNPTLSTPIYPPKGKKHWAPWGSMVAHLIGWPKISMPTSIVYHI